MYPPLHRLSDEELLSTPSRRAEAFGVFYDRHERTVVGFFLRRTRNVELAADLTSETFAVALRQAASFRGGDPPAIAWLIGIATNVLRESRRRGQVQDATRRRLSMQPVELSDPSYERVEALMDDALSSRQWDDLLDTLPPEQRDAIHARVLEERDYDEIAVQMSTSSAVVRQRVSRGLSRLRQGFTKERT